jgi:hypothetical protein
MKKNSKFFSIFLTLSVTVSIFGQDVQWEKTLKQHLEKMADSLTTHLIPWKVPNQVFKVEDFGAVADTSVMNTEAIQKAIDECSAKGGGAVLFSNGDYVTGTIELKSGVMLEIAEGSRILGSTNLSDYPEKISQFKSIMSEFYEFRQSLIYAEGVDKVGIRGKGEINFRGEKKNFPGPRTSAKIVGRPGGIRMIECKNIVLQDIKLSSSAAWLQNYIYCTNLIFDGLYIENQANFNNDGFDLDGYTNAIVRNCFVNAEDDGLCIKGGSGKPSRNLLVENSTFLSCCNAFKMGTDTQGDFENILCRNLNLGGIPDSLVAIHSRVASTAITLATVDGGNVENIYFSNIKINQVQCPVFMRVGRRFRVLPEWPEPRVGSFKNVMLENIEAERISRQGSIITGIQSHSIENVLVRNYHVDMEGVADSIFTFLPVPDDEEGYPDAGHFSRDGLPSSAFFVRNAKNVKLENVSVTATPADARPLFVASVGVENSMANGKPFVPHKIVEVTHNPVWIKNLSVSPDNIQARVMRYHNGALVYTDRSDYIIRIDERLRDAEYILWPANTGLPVGGEVLSFDIESKGDLYIAYDKYLKAPEWLNTNFELTPEPLTIKYTQYRMYKKQIGTPGHYRLGGCENDETAKKGTNYIVFFVPEQ